MTPSVPSKKRELKPVNQVWPVKSTTCRIAIPSSLPPVVYSQPCPPKVVAGSAADYRKNMQGDEELGYRVAASVCVRGQASHAEHRIRQLLSGEDLASQVPSALVRHIILRRPPYIQECCTDTLTFKKHLGHISNLLKRNSLKIQFASVAMSC